MNQSDASIRQLTETINTLAAVVAKNERRYLSIERAFRWVAVAFLCLTMLVFYLGFNMVSQVQATENSIIERLVEKVVADIIQVIHNFNQDEKKRVCDEEPKPIICVADSLLRNVDALMAGIVECENSSLKKCPDFKTTEVARIVHNMVTLTDGAMSFSGNLSQTLHEQLNQQGEDELTLASVMADIFILTHRLKLDSDSLRTVTINGKTTFNKGSGLVSGTSIHEALGRIHREIQLMNAIINREVPLMNDTMRVMVHSMGPTMGRMGTMMNSMPMMNTVW